MEIKYNPESIIKPSVEDIIFWNRRLNEHFYFLYELLDTESVIELKQQSKVLSETFCSDGLAHNVVHVMNAYTFLTLLHKKVKKNIILTSHMPREEFHKFIKHLISEQTYFVRLLNGKMTLKEEFIFWIDESSEHAYLLSQTLPDNPEIKQNLIECSELLMIMTKLSKYDPIYFKNNIPNILTKTNECVSIVKNNLVTILSELDKGMISHECIEAEYGINRIKYLIQFI